MPYDLAIPGWMPSASLRVLERLAALVPYYGQIVEIGAFCGRTTYCLAESTNLGVRIFAIDIWDPGQHPYYPPVLLAQDGVLPEPGDDFGVAQSVAEAQGSYENFQRCTARCKNVTAIRGSSPEDFRLAAPPAHEISIAADLIFIDGVHHNPDFRNDLEFWWQHTKPGSIIAGDDCLATHPDVIAETNAFAHRLHIPLLVRERLWVMQRPDDGGYTIGKLLT